MYRDRNDGKQFQSTLPTRGSDALAADKVKQLLKFQSTLPTRGSDKRQYALSHCRCQFQSTLPTRGSDLIIAG